MTCCDSSHWREAGLSGSAFVSHDQAVLAEVFDSCSPDGSSAALGGFVALPPALRAQFAKGMPMLIGNQIAQLFGPDYEKGELHYQDWAAEPLTCSPSDLAELRREHPASVDPVLRAPHWAERLYFGGAETGEREPGFMEGALDAARRIARAIILAHTRATAATLTVNKDAIATFAAWVDRQRQVALVAYERRLTRRLMLQQRDQLTQIALLEAIDATFAAALTQIASLRFDTRQVPVERGRSALTPLIQEPFRALIGGLIHDVTRFNAGSCALSNFPAEHDPSPDYMQAMLRDVAAAWAEFSQRANALLIFPAASSDMACGS